MPFRIFDVRRRAVAALLAGGLAAALPPAARGQVFVPVANPDIAAHVSFSLGASWVDVDADGDLDLYVVTGFAANNNNVLYRNDGPAGLVRVTGVPITTDGLSSACSTWGDYDNDGDVDLFVSNLQNGGGQLYEGNGAAGLTLNTTAGITELGRRGTGAAWGDYDNDGRLDLVVAALYGQGGIATGNRLFHNAGDGWFDEVTTGPAVTTLDSHHHPTWSDFDGDGDLDLFFATGGPGFVKQDRMYRNRLTETGHADFEPLALPPLTTDFRDSQVLAWVDYDNDGDLDLFAVNYSSVPNQLYRQDGPGVFTKITAGPLVNDAGAAHGVVWGDFDNDGDQDVFVARDLHQSNRYYRNEGDGTFTAITSGDFVNGGLSNYGAAAGDMDRDGDLDLFVPTARSEGPSVLYRNDLAGGNHWLEVRCVGTHANRGGIGAKVRARATIGGQPRWQLREILAGTSYGGHGAEEAHFGLADAAVVDSLIIEWPGGLVDRLAHVPANQLLTITENSTTPVLASVERAVAGAEGVFLEWRVAGAEGRPLRVERTASPDAPWNALGTLRVAPRGTARWHDTTARAGGRYGYRVSPVEGGAPMGETWVEVPAGPRLAVLGLAPGPRDGHARLVVELPEAAPATLELFSADGRRLAPPVTLRAAAGRQEVGLPARAGAHGAPVFVRLTQGGRTTTGRYRH